MRECRRCWQVVADYHVCNVDGEPMSVSEIAAGVGVVAMIAALVVAILVVVPR